MTHALEWRLEWQRKKMARRRVKRETKRVVDFALKAVYQGTGKGKWSFGKGGTRKVAKVDGRTRGRKAVARKEADGKRNVAREKPENVGRVARQDTLQPGTDNEEDLQAWCLLEDSEMSSGKR